MTLPRIFVAGFCAAEFCRTDFVRVADPDQTTEPGEYCSKPCKTRAARQRKAARCPAGCGRDINKPGAVVCGPCWNAVAGMCLGKRRLSEPTARDIEQRRDLTAYWCRCCGWWHNTGNNTEDPDELIERVGRTLTAMAKRRGQQWVNQLIESWDPESGCGRTAWKAKRPAA